MNKEIKENFKNEKFECNVYVNPNAIDIEVIGADKSDNLILEQYCFNDVFQLFQFLEENQFSTKKKIIEFSMHIKTWILKRICIKINPLLPF